MPVFDSAGLRIHYEVSGPDDGAPVVLLHGFASNGRVNWVSTGWTEWLAEEGFRVIVPDFPGHGQSDKPHDGARYPAPMMAEDVRRLLDHLNIERAHVMGYSMGARVAAFLALKHPERVCALVLSGMAGNLVAGVGGAEEIARAMLAEEAGADVSVPAWAWGFRQFAERVGNDLRALAACITASRTPIEPAALERLDMPVLVVVGSEDGIAGDPALLMPHLPADAELVVLQGRDHMNAVGDRQHRQAVADFLKRHAGRCDGNGMQK